VRYLPIGALSHPRPAQRQQLFWRKPPCWSTWPVPLQSGHSTLVGCRPWVPIGFVWWNSLHRVERRDHWSWLADCRYWLLSPLAAE